MMGLDNPWFWITSLGSMAFWFVIQSISYGRSKELQDEEHFEAKLDALRAIAIRREATEDDQEVRTFSAGRDRHGQLVMDTVRINTGQSVPPMPRPAPAARCSYCDVKLTRDRCVDGCGAPQ